MVICITHVIEMSSEAHHSAVVVKKNFQPLRKEKYRHRCPISKISNILQFIITIKAVWCKMKSLKKKQTLPHHSNLM